MSGPAPRAVPFEGSEVRIIRSPRRRKTAQARMVGGVLEVRVPSGIPAAEEQRLVEHFRQRLDRTRRSGQVDLGARAAHLARAHDLPEPAEIRWVANQEHRWGSCTPARGVVRISDRLASFPPWVLDYVVVHELAHLIEPSHSAAFWTLVARYPLAERARGYLMAKGMEEPDAV